MTNLEIGDNLSKPKPKPTPEAGHDGLVLDLQQQLSQEIRSWRTRRRTISPPIEIKVTNAENSRDVVVAVPRSSNGINDIDNATAILSHLPSTHSLLSPPSIPRSNILPATQARSSVPATPPNIPSHLPSRPSSTTTDTPNTAIYSSGPAGPEPSARTKKPEPSVGELARLLRRNGIVTRDFAVSRTAVETGWSGSKTSETSDPMMLSLSDGVETVSAPLACCDIAAAAAAAFRPVLALGVRG